MPLPLLLRPKARLGPPAQYITTAPHPQNALDLFQGEWWSSLPPPFTHLRAGRIDLWKDPRIQWAIEQLGDPHGKSVLELGPLEGAHSYLLERAGFQSVTAVEANPRAFLKCLIFKEIVGLAATSFLCGDFVEYLRAAPVRFDAVIACGVLYHMHNPVELIELLSRTADSIFFWTHYYNAGRIKKNKTLSARLTGPHPAEYAGFKFTQYRYRYRGSFRRREFCGGSRPEAHWLSKEDILAALKHFGLQQITINFDTEDHPDGPAFALIAKRPSASWAVR